MFGGWNEFFLLTILKIWNDIKLWIMGSDKLGWWRRCIIPGEWGIPTTDHFFTFVYIVWQIGITEIKKSTMLTQMVFSAGISCRKE